MKNTAEYKQWLASDPENSVFVSASAGTGKTKVLTDRFLRLMLSGVKPTNILCITFTKAAANEMLERIKKRLQKWTLIDDNTLEEDLYILIKSTVTKEHITIAKSLYNTFLYDIERIKITTIHAFCMMVLKKFPETYSEKHEIITTFKQQVLFDRVSKKIFSAQNEAIIQDSIDLLGKHFEHNSIIERIKSVIYSKTNFFNYLEQFDSIVSLIKDIYLEHNALFGQCYTQLLKSFIQKINLKKDSVDCILNANEKIGFKLCHWLNKDEPFKISNFLEYIHIFLKEDGNRKTRLVKKAFTEARPSIYKMLLEEQDNVYNFFIQYKNQLTAQINQSFIILINYFLTIYSKYKTNQKYLEYDDIILNTIELLNNSENAQSVLYDIDITIDHILIDEAQDTNQLQWRLIQAVSNDFFSGNSTEKQKTIFIVGDYKQSIYGFQGATPSIFENIKTQYKQQVLNSGNNWQEIDMQTSFRTTQPVLDLVNQTFSKKKDSLLKGLAQTPFNIEHKAFRAGDGYATNLPITKRNKDKKNNTKWAIPKTDQSSQCIESETAIGIINKVEELINSNKNLHGHDKQITPGSIMILVRKRSKVMYKIISECKKRNIPIENKDKLFANDNLIIQDILSLLKFILLPNDDLNLAGLLKTPIIGINEGELFQLAYNRQGTSLWQHIQQSKPAFHDYLLSLVDFYQHNTVYDLILKVMYQDNKIKEFSKRLGNEAADVICSFIEYITNFETTTPNFTLQKFIYELECSNVQLQSSNNNSDSIKIMTIHGSKGLQSPIVFLADSASSEQSPNESIFYHNNKIYFSNSRHLNSLTLEEVKKEAKELDKSENLRLLYVAMTRAEDELYLCGWENNKLDKSWYAIIESILDNQEEPIRKNAINTQRPSQSQDNLTIKQISKYSKEQNIIPATTLNSDNESMNRGTIIHKLLHELPLIKKDQWNEYIKNSYNEADDTFIQQITKTLNDYKYIFFGNNIYSELAMIGQINGKIKSIVVDKMIISDKQIQIIDFKTDELIPDNIPGSYIKQLTSYKQLVSKRYQKKIISCGILWTSNQKLQFI